MSESTEIMTATDAGMLENVLVSRDLSKLNPAQRLDYYRQVCQSMGLNPLTKPFDYIQLNGKLTLYAKKDATDQLRKIHGVNIDDVNTNDDGDWFIVTVKGSDNSGRRDVEIGAVAKNDMRGNYGNALMKAVTKAKRRLTLSLCGLGWLDDETEVETIQDARPVVVDSTGEIVDQPKPEKPKFDENEFLRGYRHIAELPAITLEASEQMQTSKGKVYGKMSTEALCAMNFAIKRKINGLTPEQAEQYTLKLSAINTILTARASKLREAEAPKDPHVNQ